MTGDNGCWRQQTQKLVDTKGGGHSRKQTQETADTGEADTGEADIGSPLLP